MCCDECVHYSWYYDYCDKWGCEVDARAVHNCFEKRAAPVRDFMLKGFDEETFRQQSDNAVIANNFLFLKNGYKGDIPLPSYV